jgi:hypothetical protein
MDMGFNHAAWSLGQDTGPDSGAFQGRLDWHGLRGRFLAVRAYGSVWQARGCRAGELTGASFAPSAARALAHFENASQGVNPINSADGKARLGMGEDVAGAPQLGSPGPMIEGSYD